MFDAASLDEAKLRGKDSRWTLSRRVFVPLQAAPAVIALGDYLTPEETSQVFFNYQICMHVFFFFFSVFVLNML